MIDLEPLDAPSSLLGEGVCWDATAGVLWWVDIRGEALCSFDPSAGRATRRSAPATLGGVWPAADGSLICAARHGFARWQLDAEDGFRYLVEPEPERTGNRFNDLSGDRHGRLWAGSMDDAERRSTGALYRLDPDGRCTRVLDGWAIPNSLAFSPGGEVLYATDTPTGRIVAFDHDPADGTVGPPRTFAVVDGPGHPDGSTVDAEGCLWNAEWDGWRLVRYRPDGAVDRVVELPVQRPTKCAFGGAELATLFVTTAADRLTAAELAAQPLAGAVLAIDVGVVGLPAVPFG